MKKTLAIMAAFIAVCVFSGCGLTSSEIGGSSNETPIVYEDTNKVYTVDEFCTRADTEKNFERDNSDRFFAISGEIDSKIYKSIYFKSNIERNSYSKYEIKCEFDDSDTISEFSRGDAVTIRGKLDDISLSTLTLKDCVLISSENTENSSDESLDTSQEESLPPRETAIGKSDKSIDGIMTIKATTVNNDKTGNWRYSGFSESGLDMSEYALSYYKEYFKSDKEVHAVVNFADKTTTRISCTSGMLYVTVMKYVDGEEHDADLMFSGDIISDYIVYTDNGDIEDITADEENSSSQSSEVASEPPQSSTETTPQSSEPPVETPSTSTPTQAQSTVTPSTENHVGQVCVPTSGKGTKYHLDPYCSNMENEVYWVSVAEAEDIGRTPCKKCAGG